MEAPVNTESKFLDIMTGAALMLVLASALLSVTMALADEPGPRRTIPSEQVVQEQSRGFWFH